MMEKLELKHLAPYLPYELKILKQGGVRPILMCGDNIQVAVNLDYKPLLIPLSEFNNSAADEEIFNVQKAYTSVKLNECCDFPYWQFEILVKHHFDVFNLIPANLAIKKI